MARAVRARTIDVAKNAESFDRGVRIAERVAIAALLLAVVAAVLAARSCG